MTVDEYGAWSYTSKPLSADAYTYKNHQTVARKLETCFSKC